MTTFSLALHSAAIPGTSRFQALEVFLAITWAFEYPPCVFLPASGLNFLPHCKEADFEQNKPETNNPLKAWIHTGLSNTFISLWAREQVIGKNQTAGQKKRSLLLNVKTAILM